MGDYKNEKIAIHHTPGSFSDRWIAYCEEKHIPYKVVNAYDSDIVKQVSDCTAFMWHYHHANYKDALFAKQLLYSLQIAGKKVFPDFNTTWHFDDKVGQKYLLEAIGAPLVPSYVFYDKETALQWIKTSSFPLVFKLRGGAGASNVSLIHSKATADSMVRKAFGKGFSQYNVLGNIKERYRQYKSGKGTILHVLKGFIRFFCPTNYSKMHGNEKGYAYFQDFIPNNTFDIRVIVIGDRAFSIKRLCRENDFRASGSGYLRYAFEEQCEDCVRIAFDVNERIHSQCIAYDFVFCDGKPLIVEVSYGFSMSAYDKCPGYWTKDLRWHKECFNPMGWQVENLLDGRQYII